MISFDTFPIYVLDLYREGSEKAKSTTSEDVDIDLNDPEVADAAVKIQAGFKGYKARKEVKDRKVRSRTGTIYRMFKVKW